MWLLKIAYHIEILSLKKGNIKFDSVVGFSLFLVSGSFVVWKLKSV